MLAISNCVSDKSTRPVVSMAVNDNQVTMHLKSALPCGVFAVVVVTVAKLQVPM
jgi:hypothetical protein